uniref:Uncharacterized protein n=1 Tax=Timema douglasi TaxID=61478 RepID=A0A7R8VQJ8_TIMDO|nr:unnamed protein product [Timema douglasi]
MASNIQQPCVILPHILADLEFHQPGRSIGRTVLARQQDTSYMSNMLLSTGWQPNTLDFQGNDKRWFSHVTGRGRLASNLEPLLEPPSYLLTSSGTSGVFLGRPLDLTSASLSLVVTYLQNMAVMACDAQDEKNRARPLRLFLLVSFDTGDKRSKRKGAEILGYLGMIPIRTQPGNQRKMNRKGKKTRLVKIYRVLPTEDTIEQTSLASNTHIESSSGAVDEFLELPTNYGPQADLRVESAAHATETRASSQ